MSGPKVVRIVTREEVIAICQAALRQLTAAIAEWRRVCGRNGVLEAEAIAAMEQRRRALHRALAEERFVDVQTQVQKDLVFLQLDAEGRIARAAAAAAQALQQRRRTANAARMLLAELEESGRAIPADLGQSLRSQETQVQEQAVARALALLAPVERSPGVTDRQRELASRLGGGERAPTFSEWLAAHPAASGGESGLEIDHQLALLAAQGGDPASFAARAADIAAEPPARQALLADSLALELAQAVKEAGARSAQLAMLRRWAAELAQDDGAAARDLHARIEAAIGAADVSAASTLVTEAGVLAQERLRALAAEARRRAVLQGLASLGYEVHEGMATAWVQGGRVVLRKAGTPGYGVELSGGLKSERVQVRAVAFGSAGAPRDAARDRDAETLWCAELARLRSSVSGSGGSIEIEQALAAGATPLKLIEDPAVQESADEAAQPSRTLRR